MSRDFSENRMIKLGSVEAKRSSEVLESINEIFKQEKIFVYSEGKDEKRYFDKLGKDIHSSRVKIIPIDCGGSDCYAVCKYAENELKKEVEGDGYLKDCKKYVVFDCDDNFTRTDKKTNKFKSELAKEFCSRKDFEIVFSNICFEIWILCHYNNPYKKYSKEQLLNCGFLKKECVSLIGSKGYPYNKLRLLEKVAIKNSKELIELHNSLGVPIYSAKSNPVTQIGELIEKLRGYER